MRRVAPAEHHHPILQRHQAVIGDRDPVRVTAEIARDFIERQLSSMGHRDLLVTQTYRQEMSNARPAAREASAGRVSSSGFAERTPVAGRPRRDEVRKRRFTPPVSHYAVSRDILTPYGKPQETQAAIWWCYACARFGYAGGLNVSERRRPTLGV